MITVPPELPGWIAKHVNLYLTDPERAHLWDASPGGVNAMLPTLLLITEGRKSGQKRPVPLIYKKVNDSYAVIASKGGSPAHPAWYFNLLSNPECDIMVAADKFSIRARTAEGEERQALWQQLAEIYPPYDDYQASAGTREIPVVVLDVI